MSSRPARSLREARVEPDRKAGRFDGLGRHPLAATVAVVAAAAAFPDGSYGLPARTLLAVLFLWVIVLGIAFGAFAVPSLGRVAATGVCLFAGLAVWTLASTLWAADAARAFEEFDRVVLYLAVLVLAVLGGTRRTVGQWADGLFVSIAAIAVVALGSRLFFSGSTGEGLAAFIPNATSRLSYPLGYWNALGTLAALGCPLCLRAGLLAVTATRRAAALATAPVLAAVILLTSSRGAALAATLGVVAFVLLTGGWPAVRAAAAAALGVAAALLTLTHNHALVDGPLGTDAVQAQGRTAALLIVASGLLAGGALLLAERARLRRARFRLPTWSLVGVVAGLLAVGVLVAEPGERFDSFRAPPGETSVPGSTAHLLSGSGSGRWQFWTVAFEEFERAPLHGQGAGSYEASWARYASFPYSIKNAHSLFLETLSELGLVGLVLLLVPFAAGLVAGYRVVRAQPGDTRVTVAALMALVLAFAAAAALDWVWQMPAVTLIAIAALGLLLSSAWRGDETPARSRLEPRSRVAAGAAGLAVAWVLICAQLIPWLASNRIAASQDAVRRGDLIAARDDAQDAAHLQPWSAEPYVQLALVAERAGDLVDARRWLISAISKDDEDWRLWLISSRLEAASGNAAAAATSLSRARLLNPMSPIFSGG